MKRYLGVIVVVVGLVAAMFMLYRQQSAAYKELQVEDGLVKLQRDYLERVGWIRANPDDKTYREEVNAFFRSYFKQVDDYLDKTNGNKNFDSYLEDLEKRAEKGSGKGIAEKKAAYEYVKKIFDQMHAGKYSPVWTATDKGMRLDVLTSDVKMVGGSPMIHMDVVLWGAQRELRDESSGRQGNVKKMVTSATYDVQWKLVDDKGNMLGKMSGSDPSMKIDYPERFIAEFPPQMVLGYYELDLLPAEVTKVETAFTVTSRAATGGEAAAHFTWNLDTPAEWKLKSGEKWVGATETTASPEEINPNAAAAAQKGKKR